MNDMNDLAEKYKQNSEKLEVAARHYLALQNELREASRAGDEAAVQQRRELLDKMGEQIDQLAKLGGDYYCEALVATVKKVESERKQGE